MKYKDIGNWQIKNSSLDIQELIFECFDGNKKQKLNHYGYFIDGIGRIRTLKGGDEIFRQLFNDCVTFGIWLRENDLVKLNIKLKEKIKEKPSMFG